MAESTSDTAETTFEITVTIENDKTVRLVANDGQFTYTEKGQLVKTDLIENTIKRLEWYITNDATKSLCREPDFKLLGRCLYEVLFGDPKINTALRISHRKFNSASKTQVLTLRLVISDKAGDLSSWPWELMYFPKGEFENGFHLAGEEGELIFVRQTLDGEPKKISASNREIIIVIFHFSPACNEISTENQVQAVREAIKAHKGFKLFEFKNLTFEDVENVLAGRKNPTDLHEFSQAEHLEELCKLMKDGPPDIVHIIGHGKPGELTFVKAQSTGNKRECKKPDGTVKVIDEHKPIEDPVTSEQVKGLFKGKGKKKPKLVLISTCMGAEYKHLPNGELMPSVAAELARDADIPAVIAMRYETNGEEMIPFATRFYEEIVAGKEVGYAVAAARFYLGGRPNADNQLWAHTRFASPILYLNARSLSFIPPKDVIEPETQKVAGEQGLQGGEPGKESTYQSVPPKESSSALDSISVHQAPLQDSVELLVSESKTQ